MSPRSALIAALIVLLVPELARGHCDTLNGPVVTAARTALASGDPTPVLQWVPAEAEHELHSAFEQTRQVRELSPAARELADRWFFETVVRLHRAGEGEPFTGLAPADAAVDPAVAAADEALKLGHPEPLLRPLAAALEAGVRQRFQAVLDARRHADESVVHGRELVAAYVELVHYSERVRELAVTEKVRHPVGTAPHAEPTH
jgi:hypothetical protein